MNNHKGSLGIRILGLRNDKRIVKRILRLVRFSDRVPNKIHVVTATGFIKLRGLFAFLFGGTVVIDNVMVNGIRLSTRKNSSLDHQVSVAHRLVIIICKIKMLLPVRGTRTVTARIQAVVRIGSITVRVKTTRSRRQRIVRRFLQELHTQRKNFKRVHRKGRREKGEPGEKEKTSHIQKLQNPNLSKVDNFREPAGATYRFPIPHPFGPF